MVAYSFKRRFVDPIKRGLDSAYPDANGLRPKRQTIRAERKRHATVGEEVQLYCGMRTQHCFLIGRARCIGSDPIRLNFSNLPSVITPSSRIEGAALDAFARGDGFSDWQEMVAFWDEEHPGWQKWEGILIRWEPLG